METPSPQSVESPAVPHRVRWVEFAVVFISLLIFSQVRSPIPGVNEPHYLGKAKHYWDPSWCPGDFFLESSNTHLVFYQTVGFLTQFVSLETTAWIGRIAGWALLGWGWLRCVAVLIPKAWSGVWSLWIFLAMAAVGNWSGEWMAGGIEGKVFAYGFGFWALALWWESRFVIGAALAGLGMSFHPVVGGWIVVCLSASVFATVFQRRVFSKQFPSPHPKSWKAAGLTIAVFIVCALPGVWPAVRLLSNSDPVQADQVILFQVFDRIRHHLDPMTFSHWRNLAYAFLVVVWLILRPFGRQSETERGFAWFVGAAIVIGITGVALGYGERPVTSVEDLDWRYRLLKFYPFRLADIVVPMAVAVTLTGLLIRLVESSSHQRASIHAWLLPVACFLFALLAPAIDRNPSRLPPELREDWLDVCRWFREETPFDAMAWIQTHGWGFKWYAHRAEYVSRKDCPQDADGIVEWRTRMRHKLPDAFSHEPQLSHAILKKGKGVLPIDPVYENDSYRVYDLAVYR